MSVETLSILAAIHTSKVARGFEPTADEVETLIEADIWDEEITRLEQEGLLATTVGGASPLRLTEHGRAVVLEAAGRAA
jgi:hypothetical protein